MLSFTVLVWIAFLVLIGVIIALDLGIFHRKKHVVALPMAAVRDGADLLSPLADEVERLAIASYRQARRAVILVVGSSVLLVGVAMVVLPGPAFVVIPLGLAILGLEFAWAPAVGCPDPSVPQLFAIRISW